MNTLFAAPECQLCHNRSVCDVLNRLLRYPIIAFLAVAACAGPGLQTACVARESEIVEAIGRQQKLLIVNTDSPEGAYWYLVGKGRDRFLGTGLSCLHNVESVEASPDLRFLAVLSSGEGHPMLEVVDLPTLRQQANYLVLHEIDPYPGSVADKGWQDGALRLDSDIALTYREDGGRVPSVLLLPESAEFALDPDSGHISPVTFDARGLMEHQIQQLADESSYQRRDAALALRYLGLPEAVPALERALAQERDQDVREEIEGALELLGAATY